MTNKQLLLKVIRGEETSRAAWVPFVGVHGGKLIGVASDAYLQSSDLIVRGLTRACELYQPDGLPIVFDLQLEAEVLGCQMHWGEQTPPAVNSHPLMDRRLDQLPTFDTARGRFPVVIDALRTISN